MKDSERLASECIAMFESLRRDLEMEPSRQWPLYAGRAFIASSIADHFSQALGFRFNVRLFDL